MRTLVIPQARRYSVELRRSPHENYLVNKTRSRRFRPVDGLVLDAFRMSEPVARSRISIA